MAAVNFESINKQYRDLRKNYKCESITYAEIANRRFQITNVMAFYLLAFLSMLLGPGLSILFFALASINPCINRTFVSNGDSTLLFTLIWTLYTSTWVLCVARSVLYIHGVTFCNETMGWNHAIDHFGFYMLFGASLSLYCLYAFTLNIWAIAGVILLMIWTGFWYIVVFFERHTRQCSEDSRRKGVNYSQSDRFIWYLESAIFVCWIALAVCMGIYDSQLNTYYRIALVSSGDCVASPY